MARLFYSPINSKYWHEIYMKMDKYVHMCLEIFSQAILCLWLDMSFWYPSKKK